jgi:hemoglobin/transferrin/lactoferrin receptor protein
MSLRSFSRLPALVITLNIALTTSLFAAISTTAHAEDTGNVQSYSVPAGPLDKVIRDYGIASNISLYVDSSLLNGIQSQGLSGHYSAEQGLKALLEGSGLTADKQSDGSYRIYAAPSFPENTTNLDSYTLDKIDIFAADHVYTRDEEGADDVYYKNTSTTYMGKAEIERYKGSTPADLLQGMAGIFSGDARNSGALDVNIRGIQGPGRVPVIIDGTEQALTVWRGYNGASNRSYIDPNLIGGIQVIKGPSLDRNVYTGLGGALVAKTLSVDDIIKPGDDFGAELKLEGSNGSVAPRVPELSTGQDYRTIPGFDPGHVGSLGDPTLRVEPKTSRDNDLFSTDDYAYRLAVGKRHEKFDAMVAYAYRKKGNHFSGKNNAGFYSYDRDRVNGTSAADYNPIRDLALAYTPGSEVMNTSSEMESWLGKFTWKFSDDEKMTFGIRDTDSLYGEVMPSRIRGYSAYEQYTGVIQWPLSHVDMKAYNLEYEFKPTENRWVDFYSNFWFTDSKSETYTTGGYPNYAVGAAYPTIINSGLRPTENDRYGVTMSNTMKLLDSLNLTVGGNYQYEQLRDDKDFANPAGLPDSLWGGSWSLPKGGRRQEWETHFDFSWKPTERLSFTAGARYSSYWAFDDYLSDQQKAGTMPTTATAYQGRPVSWTGPSTYTQADWDTRYQEVYTQSYNTLSPLIGTNPTFTEQFVANYASNNAQTTANQEVPIGQAYTKTFTSAWYHDGKGRYDRADNPCTNGTIQADDCTLYEEDGANGSAEVQAKREELTYTADTTAETQRGHDWAPFFSAAYNFTDSSRIYARYSESIRYPSMFESTIGFSASLNKYYSIEPEHAYNYEVAFIQDFTQWVDADFADFKIAYFQHRTKNVIDRNERWEFNNIEQQTIQGAEIQARIDTGRFFSDLGLSYTFENEVCDEHTAQFLSQRGGSNSLSIDRCVQDGHLGSYLLTQAIPEISANLTVGGRFFDRKLEIGTRLTYHKGHENKDLDRWAQYYGEFGINVPYTWDDLVVVDAYASYKVKNDLIVELTGTNLTDQYYIDPATRSAMTAPGKVLKLGVTMSF